MKTAILVIRVTPKQKAKVKRLAKKVDRTTSEFLREVIIAILE